MVRLAGRPGCGEEVVASGGNSGDAASRAAESASATHRAPLGRAARAPLGGAGSADRVAVLPLAEPSVLRPL